MPSLIQLFSDPISWAFFGIVAGLWGLETVFPARVLPPSPGHVRRGVVALVAFFLVSSYLPYWLGPLLEPVRLADLSELGTWGGALVAMLAYQTVGYAYHRGLHASDLLFRLVHQVHHSAERLDVAGAFLFAPLDMLGWTTVSTMALALFGVTPEATVVFTLAGALLSTFQHTNVRTPRWLGYVLQRPESHSQHHGRGLHRNNYADLPIFDLMFGTFDNPEGFAEQTGYYPGVWKRRLKVRSGKPLKRTMEATGAST
ncbi:MAG: fatty acid hydroxylase family protein [Myxococcales bacterium]|nr:MAG: fatty acid hydroxylase family protein [Myxococcales bacterium]